MSDIGGKLMSCSNPLNLAFKKSEQKSIRGVYGGFAPVAKQNPNLHEVMCRGVYGGFAPVWSKMGVFKPPWRAKKYKRGLRGLCPRVGCTYFLFTI
jgi:hypothetical protein